MTITPSLSSSDSNDLHVDFLTELVDSEFDYLLSYAKRYFRAVETCEDLVQETFLAATESIGRFQKKSSPRTWLVGILKHKCLNRIRQSKDRVHLTIKEGAETFSSDIFDKKGHWSENVSFTDWRKNPALALEQKHFFRALETCLTKLPEKMRQIFLLRELEGHSFEFIVEEFSLSAANLRVMMHRARVSLQLCLQGNWLTSSHLKEQP